MGGYKESNRDIWKPFCFLNMNALAKEGDMPPGSTTELQIPTSVLTLWCEVAPNKTYSAHSEELYPFNQIAFK